MGEPGIHAVTGITYQVVPRKATDNISLVGIKGYLLKSEIREKRRNSQ